MKVSFILSLFLSVLGLLAQVDHTKNPITHPGPANLDQHLFSNIYFFREKEDDFPKNWIGIIEEGNKGLSVKVSSKNIYLVHTTTIGKVKFFSKIDEVFSITLDLSAGENYYIDCVLTQKTDGKPNLKFVILSPEEGEKRLSNFHNEIKERYCIIPWPSDEDFISDCYKDTIFWYASKKSYYKFKSVPSWEVILRSKLKTTCGFRNSAISKTFSEVGGILYMPKDNFNSKEEFIQYANSKLKEQILTKKELNSRNAILWEVDSITPLPWMKYAVRVYNEMTLFASDGQTKKERELLSRTCLLYFFWKDQNNNGVSASLFTSEKGLPEELNSKEEIIKKLTNCWKSFGIYKEDK